MGRIMALDIGSKRTGVAVTDPLKIIANGLETVATQQIINFLKDYFKKETVEIVVIGYPKQMNNSGSEAVLYVNEFIRNFEKNFPKMNFQLMDERFTSKMAFQAMIDGGLRKTQRQDKALVDKISATIILQSYLDMNQNFSNLR
jgi:putative holliday junction resolvase